MRILDEDNDKKLDNVTLLLTESEAIQMVGYLKNLINKKNEVFHVHLSSEDYQKEITLSIYDENKLNHFDLRITKLIKEDK